MLPDPRVALATTLLTNQDLTVSDGGKITEIFIGPQQVWKPGERNVLAHGTVAELVAGTEADPRIWSPLVLATAFGMLIGGGDGDG